MSAIPPIVVTPPPGFAPLVQQPGRVELLAKSDPLAHHVTRRDLLAIFAYIAENASPNVTARELAGDTWNHFTLQWRAEGR